MDAINCGRPECFIKTIHAHETSTTMPKYVAYEFPQCPHQFNGWCAVCVRELMKSAKQEERAYWQEFIKLNFKGASK